MVAAGPAGPDGTPYDGVCESSPSAGAASYEAQADRRLALLIGHALKTAVSH